MLDTNVIIHSLLKEKANHPLKTHAMKQKARYTIKRIETGNLTVYVSYIQVFESGNVIESWISHQMAGDIVEFLLTNSNVKVLPVLNTDMTKALLTFKKFKQNKIGYNDCITHAVMTRNKIPKIISFDKDFDQFKDITRVES